jgi:CHAT domain-containing protein/tetratricopeptide (TPR) repeat protein
VTRKRAHPEFVVAAILLGLILPTASSGRRRLRPIENNQIYTEPPSLLAQRRKGNELFRSGEYLAAVRTFESGLDQARQIEDPRSAMRYLNNLAGTYSALLRYRDAVRAYLEARELATSLEQNELLSTIAVNLSSVYFQMGELNAATEAVAEGLNLKFAGAAKIRPKLLIQLSLLRLRQGKCDQAVAGFRDAVDAAADQLDIATQAQAWNELGIAYKDCERLPEAERSLLEAYRLRKLTGDQRLLYSYESLAELRLARNDPEGARLLLDRAIESVDELGPAAQWRPLYARGRANLALGNADPAYVDLTACLRNLENWRSQILPSDSFQVSTEGELHGVFSTFIDAANALYRKSGERRYAAESFGAAESARAQSLRKLWAGSEAPQQLPAEYWRTHAQLHKAETEGLRSASEGAEIRRLRYKLTEMETSAGLEQPVIEEERGAGALLDAAQRMLAGDEAFFGFHTGESESWLWVVTKSGLELVRLPSENALAGDISKFVEALRAGSPAMMDMGRRLYQSLFGQVSAAARGKNTWILVPDGPVFELPFGALIDTDSEGGRFLIQQRSLRITTGLYALLRRGPSDWTDTFVGVGDPIYNHADPRFSPPRQQKKSLLQRTFRSSQVAPAIELPRLAGSAREIQVCSNLWKERRGETVLLTGADANREKVVEALRRRPAVLHFAGHMLFPARDTSRGMLALSLGPDNGVDLLMDTETAGMRVSAGLVVLSACSSGQGAVLPGAGLMGMTRAWLAAGARSVVATRWPASDREGRDIFDSFYSAYFRKRSDGPASCGAILREAQIAELQAGGERAKPARWASYFCVERN